MSNRPLTKTEWLAALEELWEAAQQPRPWVGLTRADIDEIWKGKEMVLPWDYDRTLAIEAKLKEKNA